jgi:hypothetical protein
MAERGSRRLDHSRNARQAQPNVRCTVEGLTYRRHRSGIYIGTVGGAGRGGLKIEKMTLVLEGIGDGKIRVSASAWPEPKVILDGYAFQRVAPGRALAALAGRRRSEESGLTVAVALARRPARAFGPPCDPLQMVALSRPRK